MTLPGRIDARIDRSAGPDACWPWTGGRVTGYGQTILDRRRAYVHRLVLEDALGRRLSPGHMACHHCDNRPCCNPAHLYEGTAQTNSDDMWARGRAGNLLGSRRPDVTRRHVGRMHSEGRESAIETTDSIASWRELDALSAADAMTALSDRIVHGGRLPDWVA